MVRTLYGSTRTGGGTGRSARHIGRGGVFACLVVLGLTLANCGGDPAAPPSISGGRVTRVALSVDSATIEVGANFQLSVTLFDAAGATLTGKTVSFSSSSEAIATVNGNGLVTAIAPGTATITATSEGVQGRATIRVVNPQPPPPGNVIRVNPAVTYQTIQGWEATASVGELECNKTAVDNYKTEVLDRTANEIGITRLRLHLRSGQEHSVDYLAQFVSQQIDYLTWRSTWYAPVNDNNDPFTADPTKFQWSWMDTVIVQVINPMRQRLQARGEQLYVNLEYVDFQQSGVAKPFQQLKSPEEYAELVVEAFRYVQRKYGWVPDGFELLLEPENTPYNGTDVGRGLVAVARRLQAAGFNPEYIGPSNTSAANAITDYDLMINVPGARGLIDEFAYHRYAGVSSAILQGILQRATRDGARTSMLEHNQSGFDELYQDLTEGNVSAWQQFSIAYCSNRTNAGANGILFQINQADPAQPIVTMTTKARDFRQVFLYVRPGAVRVAATTGNAQLRPVAFRNANGKYVVVVKTAGAVNIAFRGLPAGTYGVSYSSNGQSLTLPNVDVTAGVDARVNMPTHGVLTLFAR